MTYTEFYPDVYHSVRWYLILHVVYENIRDDDSLLLYVIPYTEDLTGQMIMCLFYPYSYIILYYIILYYIILYYIR